MPQPRTVSLTDRLALIRNRLLSSQRFQAFAAGVPGLRGFARSSAYDLFNLCAGFSYSQILLACVELDLLHHLQDAPRTSADIASLTGLHLPGADRLVRAAVALKLAERRSGERFGVGPRGAMLLANPSVLEMVRHHKHFYADLVDPVAMLKDRPKSSNLARFWGYPSDDGPASVSEHVAAPYSALMEATQAFIAQEVLTAYNVSDHEHIMDIGGGTGAFLSAAAARAPNLAMTLVDLPEVAALAAERFKREGLENRALAHGADAFREPLPNNADLISLIRILHDHDDAPVRQLLRNIR
ncbi:MAG: methyltransferase, partial [Pseudomonadota bacterium]